jgi:hypothetical protein
MSRSCLILISLNLGSFNSIIYIYIFFFCSACFILLHALDLEHHHHLAHDQQHSLGSSFSGPFPFFCSLQHILTLVLCTTFTTITCFSRAYKSLKKEGKLSLLSIIINCYLERADSNSLLTPFFFPCF